MLKLLYCHFINATVLKLQCYRPLLAAFHIPRWGALSLLRRISSRLEKLFGLHTLQIPWDKFEVCLLLLSLTGNSVSICCRNLWNDNGCNFEGGPVALISLLFIIINLLCISEPLEFIYANITSRYGSSLFTSVSLLLITWA